MDQLRVNFSEISRLKSKGGHYYAYIKSFEKNCWFKFNDSHVTLVEEYDVHVNFEEISIEKNFSRKILGETRICCFIEKLTQIKIFPV